MQASGANIRTHRDDGPMHRIALLVLALAGCGPNGYYVANVYATNQGLIVQRCEISASNRVHPDVCHLEPVGPPPGGAVPVVLQPPPPMQPPPGMQPLAPPPPPE